MEVEAPELSSDEAGRLGIAANNPHEFEMMVDCEPQPHVCIIMEILARYIEKGCQALHKLYMTFLFTRIISFMNQCAKNVNIYSH